MIVREFRPEDAEGVAEAIRLAEPHRVIMAHMAIWQVTHAPAAQRYRLLVAEADGAIVGSARTWVNAEDAGFANVSVDPAHRGHGAGSALLAAAEAHVRGLGAVAVHAQVLDDALDFAARRGYQPVRSTNFQRLDLVRAPLLPLVDAPAGIELRTAADLGDASHLLYDADVQASADEPGHVPTAPEDHDTWRAMYWDRPDLAADLTCVAMAGGAVVAFATARTNGRRGYWSAMTGTRRDFRGRGLATLVKNHSLHRARAAGYTDAYTSNDTGNAPMLAINAAFGYEHFATEWRCTREPPPR